MVRLPFPTVSFVSVEPAATYDPFLIFIGATSSVPEPINEPLSMIVLSFLSPSKLQVIVPAPKLTS